MALLAYLVHPRPRGAAAATASRRPSRHSAGDNARIRPSFPPLHGPVAQGRPQHRRLHPARSRRGSGRADSAARGFERHRRPVPGGLSSAGPTRTARRPDAPGHRRGRRAGPVGRSRGGGAVLDAAIGAPPTRSIGRARIAVPIVELTPTEKATRMSPSTHALASPRFSVWSCPCPSRRSHPPTRIGRCRAAPSSRPPPRPGPPWRQGRDAGAGRHRGGPSPAAPGVVPLSQRLELLVRRPGRHAAPHGGALEASLEIPSPSRP